MPLLNPNECNIVALKHDEYDVFTPEFRMTPTCKAYSWEKAKYLVRAVNAHEKLVAALKQAKEHLEFCGYGDNYERDCARELPKIIDDALTTAKEGE